MLGTCIKRIHCPSIVLCCVVSQSFEERHSVVYLGGTGHADFANEQFLAHRYSVLTAPMVLDGGGFVPSTPSPRFRRHAVQHSHWVW